MAPVIIAKDLYKCYPGFPPVLRGVDITVEPGEMVAIMGPSGCGKSTMLHVLGMLHAPDAGTLEILGADVLGFNREQTAAFRRGNMGFVMQSSNLFDHSTVFENVEFPLIYEGVPPEERWERVIRALELVRLSARVNYRSNRLSGGEQQRVAIARAMVNNPRILLADEPTGALDSRTSKVVMENFRALAHEGGVAMVIVTHDPGVAEFCDSAYTLEDGVLVRRKRNVPRIAPSAQGAALLGGPPRIMNGICVGACFPTPMGAADVQQVLRLHRKGVLARVYATRGAGIGGFSGTDQYGLPVPVRRMGAWGLPGALAALLRHLRGNSTLLWRMWRRMPLRRWYSLRALAAQIVGFAAGALMARWAVDDKTEHLHALGAHGPAMAAWVAAGLTGTPFSFAVRMSDLRRGVWRGLPVIAADAAFVRCCTQEILETVRAACPGEPAEKFVLLRDGLTFPPPEDEEQITMPPRDGAVEEAAVRVLAVGRVCARKGFGDLLRACALLAKRGVPVRLTVAGMGSGLWRLRLLAWRLGLRKRVEFPGYVPHERIAGLLRHADIFVAPGRRTRGGDRDGLPTALIEAMLYGLPCVVTDLPGQTEVVEHGRNGMVVPQRSPRVLADALDELARFPDRAAALGAAAGADARRLFEPESGDSALARLMERYRRGAADGGNRIA